MARPKVTSVDIAILRLSNDERLESFSRFVGALNAAEALGLSVTLRIANDPYAEKRGVTKPLDLYAEVLVTNDKEA